MHGVDNVVADTLSRPPPVDIAGPDSCHPALLDQPAFHVQPALHDQPALQDQPALHDQPALQDQPALHDKPALHVQPALHDQPALNDQPALHDQPELHDQPKLHDQPALHVAVVSPSLELMDYDWTCATRCLISARVILAWHVFRHCCCARGKASAQLMVKQLPRVDK
jgi:hypothetical protein